MASSSRYQGSDVSDTSQPVESEERGYVYDNIGNRKQATDWDNENSVPLRLTYTANKLNQYDLITADSRADKTPSFDDDGNMTGYDGKVYTYNGENRLVAVGPEFPAEGSKRLEFVYDYMGRRISKKVFSYTTGFWVLDSTLLFVYDGWNMIAELDEVGLSSASYVWGLDLSQSMQGAGGVGGLLARVDEGGAYSYTFDGNGNVGQMLDGAGWVSAHYEYDPYGNGVKAVGALAEVNPYRFSTKYFDHETELYYYGYRYYLPELGRWLSRDPIGEEGGINSYGFLENDPVGWIDKDGLIKFPGTSAAKSFLKKKADELVGTYRDVKGHHVHAKAGFKGSMVYNPKEGFSISQKFMEVNNLDHGLMTKYQRQAFKALEKTNKPNTLKEHTRIAVEALQAGGADIDMARMLVAQSLNSLRNGGVRKVTHIPWSKKAQLTVIACGISLVELLDYTDPISAFSAVTFEGGNIAPHDQEMFEIQIFESLWYLDSLGTTGSSASEVDLPHFNRTMQTPGDPLGL